MKEDEMKIILHYYSLRKQYKQLIRKKQRQYKSKLLNSLINLENNDAKSFWKVVNEFKNSDTSVSEQSFNIALDARFQYFNGLMNVKGIDEARRVHVRLQLLFLSLMNLLP